MTSTTVFELSTRITPLEATALQCCDCQQCPGTTLGTPRVYARKELVPGFQHTATRVVGCVADRLQCVAGEAHAK